MNSRCCVTILHNKVIKTYMSESSYATESEIYRRLKNYNFIPFLLSDEHMKLQMERINAPTIIEFVQDNGYLPSHLASALKYIKEEMTKNGIFEMPDFYKFDYHIFVDSPEKSPETGGIRIIDFDTNSIFPQDNPNYQFLKEKYLKKIHNEFDFINDEKSSSLIEFKNKLMISGINKDIIEKFIIELYK